MNRETKIGLLVGLVFIIVIGVLISDHFSSVMKPPQPQVAITGQNLDRSTMTPGGGAGRGDRNILIHEDPPRGNFQLEDRPRVPDIARVPDMTRTPDISRIPPTPPGPYVPGPGPDRHIEDTASRDHTDLPAGTIGYQAKPGDTVSRMASTLLGSNTNANRDKIIKLNPALVANPNKVVVGNMYLVPDRNYRAPTPAENSRFVPLVAEDRPTPPAPRADVVTISYITQPGDSLWKIARDQCGNPSPAVVDQIRTLNKDILKGKDTVHPNLTFKLPAPSVASR